MGSAVSDWSKIARLVLLATLGVLGGGILAAQISPGPLSLPHADLEGSDQCLKCHSQKKRISAGRCLDCHQLLREQLEEQRGFHATLAEQGCERCHMEHHGKEFELVYWGEEGEADFDHDQTRFELQGAHARLSCRSCHKESLIRSKARLQQRGKDLSRTFLGLDGSACDSCHVDEHRGQFEDRSCTTCHNLEKWTEGSHFRHETARFLLLGKHRQVACDRCHARVPVDDSRPDAGTYSQYTGLPFSTCSDCHRDPHRGRLGSVCSQCHSENGWSPVDMRNFDHGRTRFALEGAHRQTKCESCHPTGVTKPPARFARCSDCHADHHLGQFADRPRGAECDACHDLNGFDPARFPIAAHQESGYPLAGAHLAVACDACHVPLDGAQIQSLVRSRKIRPSRDTDKPVLRYSYPSTLCTACHENPHESSLDRFMLERDCLTCHEIAGWRRIDFNHGRTDHDLQGGHQRAGCVDCHRVGDPNHVRLQLQFDGLSQDCVACHEDPHAGQFAGTDHQTSCIRCHAFEAWKNPRFDHNRDSSFSLDGVHVKVDCSACHPPEVVGERTIIRYKPLGQECRDCHAISRADRTGKPLS